MFGIALGLAMDALAVGLSLAFLAVSIWTPSIVSGVVAFVLSAVGAMFGWPSHGLDGSRGQQVGMVADI